MSPITMAAPLIDDAHPSITITNPTPPRPPLTTTTITSSPLNSSSSLKTNTQRLLYRGALCLPDSHMLLDGLTFTGHTGKGAGMINLLENPLALALESMRGRPTLRFMGLRKLKGEEAGEGGWVDFSGGVQLDIHPQAILSKIYFENTFCLSPISSPDGRTDVGVRIALGDSNGPDTTEILIYGQISLSSPLNHPSLHLHVARLTLTPPPVSSTHLRLPRPDDPTPRKVPFGFSSSSASSSSKRIFPDAKRRKIDPAPTKRAKKKGQDEDADENISHATEVALYGSAVLSASGPGRGLVRADSISGGRAGVFKVPLVPVKTIAGTKGKEMAISEDVFGDGTDENVAELGALFGEVKGLKGKRKARADDAEEVGDVDVGEVEKTNRAKIKKQTVKLLSSTPTSISKAHPEFKEIFGHIYRGVAFAARAAIKTENLDPQSMDRLVEAHMKLYVPGYERPSSAAITNIPNESISG